MNKQMIMGNQAIALAALKAGVNLAAGYPGTPSSEIIEFISKYKEKTGTYVEWSVNEKAAVEVAAGASYAGSRTLVTMKQVGLNVASDPVMCLSYVGVKGGMVIVSADDPGPISSQTEQDTRVFGSYSKIPVLDPSSPKEAYDMTLYAFELSEKYNTPVIVRPTTRVDHAYESFQMPELTSMRTPGTFEKDSARWVIFPRASFLNHKRIFERNEQILPKEFSESKWNKIIEFFNAGEVSPSLQSQVAREGFVGFSATPSNGGLPRNAPSLYFASGGISFAYLKEALSVLQKEYPQNKTISNAKILKIGTPYPFPAPLAKAFLSEAAQTCQSVTVFEELDPVIEKELQNLCGRENIKCKIQGKLDSSVPCAGELKVEIIKQVIENLANLKPKETAGSSSVPAPELPVRPPVLCAGCPHRGAFYAVKTAMKGQKTAYCGDIGCYTLGNAKPLDMCDTCLCMGADITIAQGFYHNESDRKCFSFIGDSTFFASGITGVVNAVYNQSRQTICILDNSTTAMTGHQPHPGTGVTMMGQIVEKISIEKILQAIGVSPIITVNPFEQEKAVQAVRRASDSSGVSAVIFKAPCIAIAQKVGWSDFKPLNVESNKCIGCRKCINELGCPALSLESVSSKKVTIDKALCTGCNLCAQVCPVKAIGTL